jgi:hypothetical protein
MAIVIGKGIRIGVGISVSSSRVLSIIEFDFQGDLSLLDGDAVDLMLGSGVEDLNLGLEGDLIDQIGVEDLLSGSGTVDLMD